MNHKMIILSNVGRVSKSMFLLRTVARCVCQTTQRNQNDAWQFQPIPQTSIRRMNLICLCPILFESMFRWEQNITKKRLLHTVHMHACTIMICTPYRTLHVQKHHESITYLTYLQNKWPIASKTTTFGPAWGLATRSVGLCLLHLRSFWLTCGLKIQGLKNTPRFNLQETKTWCLTSRDDMDVVVFLCRYFLYILLTCFSTKSTEKTIEARSNSAISLSRKGKFSYRMLCRYKLLNTSAK